MQKLILDRASVAKVHFSEQVTESLEIMFKVMVEQLGQHLVDHFEQRTDVRSKSTTPRRSDRNAAAPEGPPLPKGRRGAVRRPRRSEDILRSIWPDEYPPQFGTTATYLNLDVPFYLATMASSVDVFIAFRYFNFPEMCQQISNMLEQYFIEVIEAMIWNTSAQSGAQPLVTSVHLVQAIQSERLLNKVLQTHNIDIIPCYTPNFTTSYLIHRYIELIEDDLTTK